MPAETHDQIKARFVQRLNDEGRRDEWVRLKTQLINEGESEKTAWLTAAAYFKKPDGTLEFELPAEIASIEPPAGGGEVPPLPKLVDKNGRTQPITNFQKNLTEDAKQQLTKARKNWDSLREAVDASRSCGSMQSVQWIYDNADTPPHEINPDDVPSRGALRHLRHIASDPRNYGEFVQQVWSKTIPNKNQLDYESKFNDDGRKQFGLLDDFERSLTEPVDAA